MNVPPLWVTIFSCGLFFWANPTWAVTDLEIKVQAAYLFNFTKFVEWPSLPTDTITICVAGDKTMGTILAELSGRSLKGRVLEIIAGPIANPAQCQVLFISQAETRHSELLRQSQDGNVLTVSDRPNFAREGGIIGFYTEDGKVKVEINYTQARDARLKISAKLMEIARVVP